jgi:hypothetical protein
MRPLVDRPGFPPLDYDPPRHTEWRELISYMFNGATARRIEQPVRADIVPAKAARSNGSFTVKAGRCAHRTTRR